MFVTTCVIPPQPPQHSQAHCLHKQDEGPKREP